jgi:hypothetical protein
MIMKTRAEVRTIVTLLVVIFFAGFFSACHSTDVNLAITEIKILELGKSTVPSNTEYVSACQSFKLSEKQISDYFRVSRRTSREEIHDKFDTFPCYISGSARLDKKPVTWTIYAGGVGYIEGANDDIALICEKACCDKINGVC